MQRRGLPAAFVATLFFLAGCPEAGEDGDAGETSDPEGTTGEEEDESNTTPTTETDPGTDTGTATDPTGGELMFELEDVFGVPNLDDDDEDGTADWFQFVFEGDNDVSTLSVPGMPDGWSVHLAMSGDLVNVRVWDNGEFALGTADTDAIEEYDLNPGPDGTTLEVEFGDYNVAATLTATASGPDGEELVSEIALRGSPLIMNHHLQPAELVWVVETNGNADMVADYGDRLGSMFIPINGPSYGFDPWIQDEIEFATSTGNEGQRLNEIIDSIRDRGLDPFPENELVAPDYVNQTWGNPAQVTSWDSFGNLEASPPVTVNGTDYPFGRIYYGKEGNTGLHPELADFLVAQQIQAPVEMDTFWLCVGHVDEFQTFVPDPSSEKGFKFLISDVPSAYEIIDSLPAGMALTRYAADHGYATAGDFQPGGDDALRQLNMDLQADEIDPILQQFRDEFGIEDEDIIRIPSLFETIGGCGGTVAALIPGMVNLIVANREGGDTDLFIPDPYFRTNTGDQSTDPIIEAFTAQMPDGLILNYVDNWDTYHLALGEVHCGTNVLRTPTDNWWEVGLHLLEG